MSSVGPAPADAAYQGRPGAYSETAARRLCGPGATCLPCDTLRDVFDAIADGRARRAVVPVENSLAGAVPGAFGLLCDRGLVAHAEVVEAIDHVLAAPPGVRIDSRPVKDRPFEYEFLLEALVASATDAGPLVEALGPDAAIRVLGCVPSMR